MMRARFGSPLWLVFALFAAVLCALAPEAEARKDAEASLLPPGSNETPQPSLAIFPPQQLPLRFDHAKHVAMGRSCASCHPGAQTSHDARDRLLPSPLACDECHGTDHKDLLAVRGGGDAGATSDACGLCHDSYLGGDGSRVKPVVVPAPNLKFDHAVHAARNIGCGQCHGAVERVGLATRDQLPRMAGCLRCHQHPDAAARGTAKASCETCHIAASFGEAGRIRTAFPSGKLMPPRWLHGAEHTPDFVQRHKDVAGQDSAFCGSCHQDDFCVACHDGRVRPRSIHPNDYISMHAVEARMATQRCESCHRDQSFCLQCHMRSGVSQSGPVGVRSGGRFHPPKETWSDPPRKPGHHAVEAQRNLNACVSCHTERDCVVCHGGRGIGAGFNPHRPGFSASCSRELAINPRPCLVCHDPNAPELARCR